MKPQALTAGPRPARRALAGLALVSLTVLAGCAHHPSGGGGHGGGGGYYQNDGPPDDPHIDWSKVKKAVPRDAPPSRYGNPASYTALGKRYYVLKSASGFTQTGRASWYGRQFDGDRTSSGESYDMFAMTAAHKRLPIPSWVRVTNLENGRHCIVKVNDRGPFHTGRIIDLSYVAARRLGIVANGSARVRIRTVTPADYNQTRPVQVAEQPEAPLRAAANPPTDSAASGAPSASPPIHAPVARTSQRASPPPAAPARPARATGGQLQLGAFSDQVNAVRVARRLRQAGISRVFIMPPTPGVALYRVRMGPFATVGARHRAARQLAAQGYAVRLVKR